MSRHKLVKALDLEEELDDFDGGAADDVENDLNPEDKGMMATATFSSKSKAKRIEHLRRGTSEVRQTLGTNFPVTDQEIEDSLYYYYYDVEKTVNYLLSTDRLYALYLALIHLIDQTTKAQAKKSRKDRLSSEAKSSKGKSSSLFSIFAWNLNVRAHPWR